MIRGEKHCLRSIPFEKSCLSIHGYDDPEDPEDYADPGVAVYIKSKLASRDKDFDVWYRLNKAGSNYERFRSPFIAVSQLTKHVVDYMETQPKGSTRLANFQAHFHDSFMARYSSDATRSDILDWKHKFGDQRDLRCDVHAYKDFIYGQAYNLSKQLLDHPVWVECIAGGQTIIKSQRQVVDYTMATSFVYESFQNIYFCEMIRPIQLSDKVQQQRIM